MMANIDTKFYELEDYLEIYKWDGMKLALIQEIGSPYTIAKNTHLGRKDFLDVEKFMEYILAIDQEIKNLNLEGKTKQALLKVRVNQGEFRKRILSRYSHCCLCDVHNPNFLIASHIKPWSESEPVEKLDIDNGLLLCPNHDALFDNGYISFGDDGKILISSSLSSNDLIALNINSNMRIQITEGNRKYLSYHRKIKFKK